VQLVRHPFDVNCNRLHSC